ncbi:MAG: beta-ketoacyl synthase chain length factor [Nitrospirae bacterium YQR-1]
MKAGISGLGMITPFGVGVEHFWQGLRGRRKPQYVMELIDLAQGQRELGMFKAVAEGLKDYISPALLRRIDPLAQKALLCSILALKDAGIVDDTNKNIGIVTGTGYGCLNASFNFQDSLIDYGDSAPSPTDFINSVHNSICAQISIALKITGPVTTISSFELTTAQVIETAAAWLKQDSCDYVFACIGDENHMLRNYATALFKEGCAQDDVVYEPGEFFVSFVLSKDDNAKYGCIKEIQSSGFDYGVGCTVQYTLEISQGNSGSEPSLSSELSGIERICGYSPCVDALYLCAAAVIKSKQVTLSGKAIGRQERIIIKRGKDKCFQNYIITGGKCLKHSH